MTNLHTRLTASGFIVPQQAGKRSAGFHVVHGNAAIDSAGGETLSIVVDLQSHNDFVGRNGFDKRFPANAIKNADEILLRCRNYARTIFGDAELAELSRCHQCGAKLAPGFGVKQAKPPPGLSKQPAAPVSVDDIAKPIVLRGLPKESAGFC